KAQGPPKAKNNRNVRTVRDGNARLKINRIVPLWRVKMQTEMIRQCPEVVTTPIERAVKRPKRDPRPPPSPYLHRHLTVKAMILPTINWWPDPLPTRQTIIQTARIPVNRVLSRHNAALDGGSAFCL
ncbi:uncharacterized protein METZ01_LOCUS426477, partial [marine metagenome]